MLFNPDDLSFVSAAPPPAGELDGFGRHDEPRVPEKLLSKHTVAQLVAAPTGCPEGTTIPTSHCWMPGMPPVALGGPRSSRQLLALRAAAKGTSPPSAGRCSDGERLGAPTSTPNVLRLSPRPRSSRHLPVPTSAGSGRGLRRRRTLVGPRHVTSSPSTAATLPPAGVLSLGAAGSIVLTWKMARGQLAREARVAALLSWTT